jgi:hypothetical protein
MPVHATLLVAQTRVDLSVQSFDEKHCQSPNHRAASLAFIRQSLPCLLPGGQRDGNVAVCAPKYPSKEAQSKICSACDHCLINSTICRRRRLQIKSHDDSPYRPHQSWMVSKLSHLIWCTLWWSESTAPLLHSRESTRNADLSKLARNFDSTQHVI